MAAIARPITWEEEEAALPTESLSQWQLAWRRLLRHRLAMLGAFVLIFFVLASLLASVDIPSIKILSLETPPIHFGLAPYEFDAVDMSVAFSGPTKEHIFGTDVLGRDTFTRLLYAGRISLSVAGITTILSVIIGVIIGAVAGYIGGWVDTILMRFTDIMLTLPVLPLLMIASKSLREMVALQKMFGQLLSVVIIIAVITIFGWMTVARLVYGSVLSLREREFMEATRALGASGIRLIFSHLVPNSLAPIIVSLTLEFGAVVVYEATLSFLGFGIMPPTPSWGNMLTDVQRFILRNPWLAFYPGMCIFLTVLAINFLGDGLRDALDPRLKI